MTGFHVAVSLPAKIQQSGDQQVPDLCIPFIQTGVFSQAEISGLHHKNIKNFPLNSPWREERVLALRMQFLSGS